MFSYPHGPSKHQYPHQPTTGENVITWLGSPDLRHSLDLSGSFIGCTTASKQLFLSFSVWPRANKNQYNQSINHILFILYIYTLLYIFSHHFSIPWCPPSPISPNLLGAWRRWRSTPGSVPRGTPGSAAAGATPTCRWRQCHGFPTLGVDRWPEGEAKSVDFCCDRWENVGCIYVYIILYLYCIYSIYDYILCIYIWYGYWHIMKHLRLDNIILIIYATHMKTIPYIPRSKEQHI